MITGLENTVLGNTPEKQFSGRTGVLNDQNSTSAAKSLLASASEIANKLGDLIDLSSEARAQLANDKDALNNLTQGRGDLARQAANGLRDQLGAIREQLDFLRGLLENAGTAEQRDTVLRGIAQTGDNLAKVGRQLGLLQGGAEAASISRSETSLTAFSLSASFNRVVEFTDDSGNRAVYRETLNVDFSFVQVENSTQSAAVSQNPEGDSFSVFANAQSTQLTASSLSVSSEKSIEVYGASANANINAAALDPVAEAVREFSALTKSFRDVVAEFEEKITSEERIPPSIFNQMKILLEAALNAEPKERVQQDV